MNLNDQELAIDTVSNYKYTEVRGKISFYEYELCNEFQISRILLRPINRAEVIVKAVSRKPK